MQTITAIRLLSPLRSRLSSPGVGHKIGTIRAAPAVRYDPASTGSAPQPSSTRRPEWRMVGYRSREVILGEPVAPRDLSGTIKPLKHPVGVICRGRLHASCCYHAPGVICPNMHSYPPPRLTQHIFRVAGLTFFLWLQQGWYIKEGCSRR